MTAALDTEFARWQAQIFEFDLLDVRCTGVQDWQAQGRPIEPLAAAARSV